MADDLAAIAATRHARPHDALGRFESGGRVRIVTWRPAAVAGRFAPDGPALEALQREPSGLFAWEGPAERAPGGRVIRWTYGDGSEVDAADPWLFPLELESEERRAFHTGDHTSVWRMLGAHHRERHGVAGTRFAVWAPHAQRVSVVGGFNHWDGRHHPMTRHDDGVWETFLPGVGPGDLYKFELTDANGALRMKADPFARYTEARPRTASIIVPETVFPWGDSEWMASRPRWDADAISFYEVHLGSWMRHADGSFLGYRELGERLAAYVHALGFTHVELLPVTEHPFDGSWGYQCTGWYAPTRRFGAPDDFRALVDILHRHGIGVVMDWVPGHFPRDDHGLARFDGTPLFEPADRRRADMPDWGTLAFDHGRPQVRSFLVSSALYWLREFHIDGLRVDAVASMLYLDYAREGGDWLPNAYGGNENLDAVAFLQQFNIATHGECPDTFTVAEESTSWPGVTRPTHLGGLGFSMKWNMGWMHDTLSYMRHDPVHRHYHHDNLTFGLLYAFSENFTLPLSHDEVVHLKGSLLGKMPGDDWQRFANLRLLYVWQFTYPGKKLLFMGGEFGQPDEWDHDTDLDWGCLDNERHAGVHRLVSDLAHCHRAEPALYRHDFSHDGFAWIDCHDATQSVISYRRMAEGREVVVALNFTPVPRHDYRIGLPRGGRWREAVNSDSQSYGGSGQGNYGAVDAEARTWMGLEHSVSLTLPPLAGVVLVPDAGDD